MNRTAHLTQRRDELIQSLAAVESALAVAVSPPAPSTDDVIAAVRHIVMCGYLYRLERGANGCLLDALHSLDPVVHDYTVKHGWANAYQSFFPEATDED